MHPIPDRPLVPALTRRALLGGSLGAAALASLMPGAARATGLHHRARAKRVIFLFQFGGPSQLDLFDHKPKLRELHGAELPASVRGAGAISGLTRKQKGLPLVASAFRFERHGESRASMSELLPHTARLSDRLCFVKSVVTDAVAHDPALTFMQSGSPQPGKPSAGSWITYGLGSENQDLPAYVVLTSNGRGHKDTQPLGSRLWSSGFLPSRHQGVQFRSSGDPVLFLSDPPGLDRGSRRAMLDTVRGLNEARARATGDPEIDTRIAQYEMAFRMQTSVPALVDLGDEPDSVLDLYGPFARKSGTYAANCVLARRLAERGVRFIQLFHRGWDQHDHLPEGLRLQCEDTDQPSAALIADLERRGLLDETLVVWGGEFGRTSYCQGKMTATDYGRDHHGRCFTVWLAGGGARGGLSYGETDELGYNVVANPVTVHDLHATLLHLMGLDHRRLTFRHQGVDHRLSGLDGHAKVVEALLG